MRCALRGCPWQIFNIVVKPDKDVMSYLTPLTGLTKERVDAEGVSFEEAMKQVRQMLPKESILVGLNIQKDVEWLDLKRGDDFHEVIDLAFLFRVRLPPAPQKSIRVHRTRAVN